MLTVASYFETYSLHCASKMFVHFQRGTKYAGTEEKLNVDLFVLFWKWIFTTHILNTGQSYLKKTACTLRQFLLWDKEPRIPLLKDVGCLRKVSLIMHKCLVSDILDMSSIGKYSYEEIFLDILQKILNCLLVQMLENAIFPLKLEFLLVSTDNSTNIVQ